MKTRKNKSVLGLSLEALERRDVPATWGIPWADPQHLTASFVPDGASVEGSTSALYQKLDAQLGAGKWEATILSAIETWASNANVNISLVGDSGAPIGVAGLAQGDARFGDIRISAAPLSPGVLAITSPYDPSTGTSSGDMILNSNANFQPGTANSYDLYTVALHEAGHIFGFADSTDPKNFMYNGYNGPVTGLQPAAVSAIQAAYGAPVPGTSEQAGSALKFSTATPINPPTPKAGAARPSLGELASGLALAGDTALFQYTTTSGADYGSGIDFVIRTDEISLLAPKLTVYSSSGAVLGTASAAGPLDGGVVVHLDGVANVAAGSTGATYYLAVTGSGSSFVQGQFQVSASPTVGTIAKTIAVNSASTVPLPVTSASQSIFSVGAAIDPVVQSDLYSFTAPASASHPFMIGLTTWGNVLVKPTLGLYDSAGNPISSLVAPTATGFAYIQVPAYTPGSNYYVRVVNGGPGQNSAFGHYFLTVDISGTTSTASMIEDVVAPFLSGGTSPSTASTLTPFTPGNTNVYQNFSHIGGSGSSSYFKITTPSQLNNRTLYASVLGLGIGGFAPQVTVTDASGASVNSSITCAEGGMYVVEVPQANNNTTYLFKVTGGAPGSLMTTGDFILDVSFDSVTPKFTNLVSGGLSQANSSGTTNLAISTDQVYRFILAAGSGPVGSGLLLQVFDSGGHVVATLSTAVNQTTSLTTRLATGSYTVKVVPTFAAQVGNIQYSLTGFDFTDPIRVYSSSSTTASTPAA